MHDVADPVNLCVPSWYRILIDSILAFFKVPPPGDVNRSWSFHIFLWGPAPCGRCTYEVGIDIHIKLSGVIRFYRHRSAPQDWMHKYLPSLFIFGRIISSSLNMEQVQTRLPVRMSIIGSWIGISLLELDLFPFSDGTQDSESGCVC